MKPQDEGPAQSAQELISRSVEETERFGESLGRCLRAGDVIALVGELGTGKTTVIRGLAAGLGIERASVRSPTFVLLREYAGRVGLIHVDAYRLEGSEAAVWLDLAWLFDPRKVTVIEWADRLSDCLPEDRLELHLRHRTTNQRGLRLLARGPRSTQRLAAFREHVHSPQTTVHGKDLGEGQDMEHHIGEWDQ